MSIVHSFVIILLKVENNLSVMLKNINISISRTSQSLVTFGIKLKIIVV